MKIKYLGKTEFLTLTHGKIYEVISIEKDWYRIVDDSGEDYLYPPHYFDIVGEVSLKRPTWCMECPFYYPGMTPEDYLYLQYLIRNGKHDIALKIQKGIIQLPALSHRTKEDVFDVFEGDLNYEFDYEKMC